MGLFEDWQQLVTASLKGQDFAFSKALRDGTLVQPLYIKGAESLAAPSLTLGYCNILPAEGAAITDELLKSSSAGVFCSKIEHLQKYQGQAPLYLSPSLTSMKESEAFIMSRLEQDSSLHLGFDPWAMGLHEGRLSTWDEEAFPLRSEVLNSTGLTAFRFSGEAYHLAGAHNVHELSILMATVIEVLNSCGGARSVEELLPKMSFELALSPQPFEGIAKLQAFRLLWEEVVKNLGVEKCNVPVYGRPSLRYLSSREPWNNIMRLTLMNFASQLGGANGFFHESYDCYSQKPWDDGHIARNISLILQKESGFQDIVLPALGSGYMDSLTEQYCEKAWSFFQEIQSKGGLLESLLSGWLQKEIAVSHEQETSEVVCGEKKIIGINHFASMKNRSDNYKFVAHSKSIEALWEEKVGGRENQKFREVQPLRPFQLSSLFEDWQRKSDSYEQDSGTRPQVSVYCQDIKSFKDRIQWLQSFLGSGGIQVEKVEADQEPRSSIVFCLGYDPDDKSWSERLQEWQKSKARTLYWFGEKESHNFKNLIHKRSQPISFYEKAYRIFLEGQ